MIFVEFGSFSRSRVEQLDDEEFRALQNLLVANPEAGALIPGTGGLRKLRWPGSGRGKRGGLRVIYYHLLPRSVILLLLMYPKNRQDDLTPEQKRILRHWVKVEVEARKVSDGG